MVTVELDPHWSVTIFSFEPNCNNDYQADWELSEPIVPQQKKNWCGTVKSSEEFQPKRITVIMTRWTFKFYLAWAKQIKNML